MKAISEEGIMRNDMSYLELWNSYCSAEQGRLSNFNKGHCEEHFCEIILCLDHWFRRTSC